MNTSEVILFIYDEKEHFEKNLEFLGESLFAKIILVENLNQLEEQLAEIEDSTKVFLAVHTFYTSGQKGIRKFLTSGIPEKYPLLDVMYISDGNGLTIKKELLELDIPIHKDIFKYHQVKTSIEKSQVRVYTKKEIVENNNTLSLDKNISVGLLSHISTEYVIITALEDDEMEQILPLITKEGEISDTKYNIEYGYFTENPDKKVAYVSQPSTGMVDASILATEMILRFNPKFLIMPGVMGGKPNDTNIGDIIVSTKVFTIDKGKLTDEEFRKELEVSNTDSAYITKFKREKIKIKRFIEDSNFTRTDSISIHFEPIACVRSVIDKEGYFAENILINERKAIGLEMESYGIARACELVNNGATVPLIIKSVMDNTTQKSDSAKKYAAWTSSMFIKYIIINNLI